jgi:hypothetical protein
MTDNKLREKIADLFENEIEALNHGQVIVDRECRQRAFRPNVCELIPCEHLHPATNAEVLAGKARKV